MNITKERVVELIKEEVEAYLLESPQTNVEFGVQSNEFRQYTGRNDVGTAEDAQDLQNGLGKEFHVIDPGLDMAGFRTYVQQRRPHPQEAQIIVVLATGLHPRSGERTTYFKTLDDEYGKITVSRS